MLYRATATRRRADGTKYTVKTGSWRGRYVDPATGKSVNVNLKTGDRSAAQLLLSHIEIEAAMVATGRQDKYAEHRKRPLSEHLDDWFETLTGDGVTAKHAEQQHQRATHVCRACGFQVFDDIRLDAVSRYMGRMRVAGKSTQTRNHYRRAVHQFTLWLRGTQRAPDDALAGLKVETVTDARVRGVFTVDELHTLYAATEASDVRRRMTGFERRLFYQIAAETGLRSREVRTLTWGCVNLDESAPCVTVTAGNAKNRRLDVQPLTPALVALLGRHRAERMTLDPAARVFPETPDTNRVARMLYADMAAAGLPENDADGNRRDFHSLRHTFGTAMAEAGVSPKDAQAAMRHSSYTLTERYYRHNLSAGRAGAIERLGAAMAAGKPNRQADAG